MTKMIGVITEYNDEEGKTILITSDIGEPINNFLTWNSFNSWLNENKYMIRANYIYCEM